MMCVESCEKSKKKILMNGEILWINEEEKKTITTVLKSIEEDIKQMIAEIELKNAKEGGSGNEAHENYGMRRALDWTLYFVELYEEQVKRARK